MQNLTSKRAEKLLGARGFAMIPDRGFLSGRRELADGRCQMVRLFTWSNRAVADAHGIPRGYVVVAPCLVGSAEVGRYRVPLVQWPTAEQEPRSWAEVADEIDEVFLAVLDLPDAEIHASFDALDPVRYTLT